MILANENIKAIAPIRNSQYLSTIVKLLIQKKSKLTYLYTADDDNIVNFLRPVTLTMGTMGTELFFSSAYMASDPIFTNRNERGLIDTFKKVILTGSLNRFKCEKVEVVLRKVKEVNTTRKAHWDTLVSSTEKIPCSVFSLGPDASRRDFSDSLFLRKNVDDYDSYILSQILRNCLSDRLSNNTINGVLRTNVGNMLGLVSPYEYMLMSLSHIDPPNEQFNYNEVIDNVPTEDNLISLFVPNYSEQEFRVLGTILYWLSILNPFNASYSYLCNTLTRYKTIKPNEELVEALELLTRIILEVTAEVVKNHHMMYLGINLDELFATAHYISMRAISEELVLMCPDFIGYNINQIEKSLWSSP